MRIDRLRRRDFIKLVGGTGIAWPLGARAQKPATPVIGFLNSESPDLYLNFVRAFHQGLKELGFVEGQNVTMEYRWANGQYDRLAALAIDLHCCKPSFGAAGKGGDHDDPNCLYDIA